MNDINALEARMRSGHLRKGAILISSGGLSYEVIEKIKKQSINTMISEYIIYCGNLQKWQNDERIKRYYSAQTHVINND